MNDNINSILDELDNIGREIYGDQGVLSEPVSRREPMRSAPSPRGGDKVAEFVSQNLSAAQRVSEELDVPVDAVLGQWGLETGWGRSVIPGTNNLGNIKDFSGNGVKATDNMTGSRDAYRTYESTDQFADDFINLLGRNKRYQGVVGTGNNPALYFTALKQGGYAEDPAYVAKGLSATNMVRSVLGGQPASGGRAQQAARPQVRPTDGSDRLAADARIEEAMRNQSLYSEALRPPTPVEPATFGEKVADVGLSFAQGAIGAGKSLTDLFGASNSVSDTLQEASEFLQGKKSDESQAKLAASQQRIKDAEGGAWTDEAGAYLQMLWDQPAELIAQGLGSFVTLGAGKLVQAAKLASAAKAAGMTKEAFALTEAGVKAIEAARDLGMKTNILVGMGQGVGAVKGSQYDVTYKAAKDRGLSDAEALELADAAQAYGGPGALQQALGGALGYLAMRTGPIERMVLGAEAKGATALGGAAKGFFVEGGTEGLQGGQERYAGNDAAISAGVMNEADRWTGVVGQGLQEGVVGGLLGAPVGGIEGALSKDPLANVRQKAEEGGALSKAALAGQSEEFGKLADDLSQTTTAEPSRFDAIKASARETIEKLRKLNPTNASEFLEAMAVAQNPNTPDNLREQALSDLEKFTQYAKDGKIPGAESILSDERGLSVPTVTDAQQSTETVNDAPALETARRLYGPNVIDGEVNVTESYDPGGEPPSGPTGPGGAADIPKAGPIGAGPSAGTGGMQTGTIQVPAPKVDIPAGRDTAQVRKLRAQFDALAAQGFETVVQAEDGPRMVNSKTGQYFPLTGTPDVALAKAAIKRRIDAAANQAATSPTNDLREPTEAQKLAGNYKKGEPFDLNGFRVVVENPAGSTRRGKDKDGKEWESPIIHHYGDLKGVKGLDGDEMDVFVGPDPSNQKVFVIDQIDPKTGKLDEHKVMMGFRNLEEAKAGYLGNYEPGWKGLGNITEMSLDEFRSWTKSDGITRAAADAGVGQSQTQPKVAPAERAAFEADAISRLAAAEAGRGVKIEAAPPGAATDAVNKLLDAWEKITGYRGIAVKATGGAVWDGVYNRDLAPNTFFVNVDKPMMAINQTIAHEFKHLTERFPSLKKLYDKLWDMIPEEGRRSYYNQYLIKQTGRAYEQMTEADAASLKDEMLADFMGKRFGDATWLRQLAKQKPQVFADFIKDWARILQRMIDEVRALMGIDSKAVQTKDIDQYLKAYEGRLQEALNVALEVAAEWAANNPKQAEKSGLNDIARQGVDASMKYSRRVGPDHPLVIDDYVLPEVGIFATQKSPNITYLPNLDARGRSGESLPVRIRIGNHGSDVNLVTGRVFGQFGLKHRIENAAQYPARRLASSFEAGNGFAELEAAARDMVAAVISAKTAYRTERDGQAEIVTRDGLGVILAVRKDSVTGERFWDVVTTIPRTREWISRHRKNPVPIYGLAFDGLDAQQSSEIADELLKSLRAPSPTHLKPESLTLDADRNIVNDVAPKTSTAVVEKRPRVLPRDANGKIILKRAAPALDGAERAGPDAAGGVQDLGPRLGGNTGEGAGDAAAGPGLQQNDNAVLGADAGTAGSRYSIKDQQPGVYGTSQDGSRRIVGIHFSTQPRALLNSAFYGTGLKGLERERLNAPENADIKPRIFFYVDMGKGVTPEAGVGGVKHVVQMNNLYDVLSDPKGLVASTRGKGYSEAERASAWERAIMQAGYDGYVKLDPVMNQGFAVLVGKHQVVPKMDVESAAVFAPSKATPKTRKEGNELVRTPNGNEEVMALIHAIRESRDVAPSFKMQWGDARVLESEAPVANAILKSKGSTFQFSMRNYVELPTSTPKSFIDSLMSDNYSKLKGVDVEVSFPTDTGGTAKLTVDAREMLIQIDKRQQALEMVRTCLL